MRKQGKSSKKNVHPKCSEMNTMQSFWGVGIVHRFSHAQGVLLLYEGFPEGEGCTLLTPFLDSSESGI